MKLRRKLIYLLATFALFVVAATSFTIYSIQLLIEDAVTSFHEWMSQSSEVSNLRIATGEHVRTLQEIVEGRRPLSETYRLSHDQFFDRLEQAAADGVATRPTDPLWRDVARLGRELGRASSQCLELVESGRAAEAGVLLAERITGDLADKLDARLRAAQPRLEERRNESVSRLFDAKMRVLFLAILLIIFAGVLLVGGGVMIGRWLIAPIADLQRVADEFRRGHLQHRARPRYSDELGQLGLTLNTMAGSLSGTRKELHTSEAKYRALFHNLRDAVVICDDKGVIVECHDGDTHLLGVEGKEPVGRRLLDAWPDWRTGTTDWASLIYQVSRTGRLFRAEDVELTYQPDAQSQTVVDLVVYPVEYADARYVAILLRDVRERHRLQRRIRQAEKMETAGTLAGGVAHDFNNLLTCAIGALSLIESEGDGDKTGERIKTSLRACWQAAGLSRRLLKFAHGGHSRPQVVRFCEVVELILGSQDEAFFKGLELRTELDADVLVRIDKDELTQVILNLIRNAKDAMSDRGELRIRVDSTEAPRDGESETTSPFARLTIQDNGVGMPPDVRQRIFEPFFTTKARTSRRGTGMGMAVAYSAVRGAGGFIDVDSEVGVGTTVQVYLPLADGTPESLDSPTGATLQRAGRTVLLVDDDPMVLHTCTDALETLGCSVLTAESIAEGRRKLEEAGSDAVTVAVIDLVLSDGSGMDLAKSLVASDPRLRLILMTGFGDTAVPKDLEGYVLAVLSKPFRLDELAAALSATKANTGFTKT